MNQDVEIPRAAPEADASHVDDVFGPEFDAPIADTISVDRTLWWLKKIAAEKAGYQAQVEEAQAFYARRMAQCDQATEFAKARIEAYLKEAQRKKLATPNGTVFFQKTKSVVWPEDEVLIAFAREQGLQGVVTEHTITKIDKAALKKYIATSNQAPIGFEQAERTTLAVRMVNG
jgi:hypothetical protein